MHKQKQLWHKQIGCCLVYKHHTLVIAIQYYIDKINEKITEVYSINKYIVITTINMIQKIKQVELIQLMRFPFFK